MSNINDELKKQIPEIYCAISIVLNENADANELIEKLNQLGIVDVEITTPKFESIISLEIAVVRNEKFWYLDEALTKMFNQIDNYLVQLKKLINDFEGKVCIDIAFYQYGTYPALEFMGDNMKKIRFLEADISIDAY